MNPGQRLGPDEIVEQLGAGGMSEPDIVPFLTWDHDLVSGAGKFLAAAGW